MRFRWPLCTQRIRTHTRCRRTVATAPLVQLITTSHYMCAHKGTSSYPGSGHCQSPSPGRKLDCIPPPPPPLPPRPPPPRPPPPDMEEQLLKSPSTQTQGIIMHTSASKPSTISSSNRHQVGGKFHLDLATKELLLCMSKKQRLREMTNGESESLL